MPVLGKHSHMKPNLPNSLLSHGQWWQVRRAARDTEGNKGKRSDRRSSIKGPILLEIYRGDILGGEQISWTWPPLLVLFFILSGKHYQGLAKPACFDGCHAERPRGSKLISPRFLYTSLGLIHPFFHHLKTGANSRLVLVIVYSRFYFNVCICLRFPRNTIAIFVTTTIYVCNCCSQLCLCIIQLHKGLINEKSKS